MPYFAQSCSMKKYLMCKTNQFYIMKKYFTAFIIFKLWTATAFCQQLSQTVRGTIMDSDTKIPLTGVVITLSNGIDVHTTSDENGRFKLENVPVGRVSLQLSYIGYQQQTISQIEVSSGKEVVLDLSMQENIVKLEEVIVRTQRKKGEASNEMSLLSARSISVEETKRYTNSFNDPARVLSSYAGVAYTPNGGSDVIVRGNSPKYMQWRLEGVEISTPYHFDDQNVVSGGLTAINNNLLASSDFYTGAFSPEYGNALSSVYDLKYRAGNNEKLEASVGVGLIGTDVTLEGPFKKGYSGSYLINYRYSTISVLQDLKIVEIDGLAKFQDASFNIKLPTSMGCTFSFFGFWGKSSFYNEDITPEIWSTPGNTVINANTSEAFDKRNHVGTFGLSNTRPINDRSFIKTILAWSSDGIDDEIVEKSVRDSVISKHVSFENNLRRTTFRASMTYHNKINARNKIEIGTKYASMGYDYNQSIYNDQEKALFKTIDFDKKIGTIRNFISWRHRFTDQLTLVTGFHNMNVLLNKKSTIEPRLAIHWKINENHSINAGFGCHSAMESVPAYFAKVRQADGTITEPNKKLGLLRARHVVAGYEIRFTENLRAKIEAYYQDLFNLPVEDNDTSFYTTLNEGTEYRYVPLVNKGTGKNTGLELTVERFFANNYFFLVTASIFDSKYKALEGIERNTRYNNNYIFNILAGKEFPKLGKKQNKTFGINVKLFMRGGQPYIPLLRDDQGNLAVDPAQNRYWDYKNAYNKRMEDIYSLNLSVSYKINRPNVTHEIYLDLQNLTNNLGKLEEYYNEKEEGSVGYVKQMFFFPNLMYKLYF